MYKRQVENHVDFAKSRNSIVAAVILVTALGLGTVAIPLGSVTVELTALAVASIAGIVLNAVLPGKDYNFDEEIPQETGVSFEIHDSVHGKQGSGDSEENA